MNIQQSIKEIKTYLRHNLTEAAQEILNWKKTALLNNGEGGVIRTAFGMLPDNEREVMGLRFIEMLVSDLCLEVVANHLKIGETNEF